MKLPVSRTALLSTLAYAALALSWLWLVAGMLSDFGALGGVFERYLVWAGGGFVLITAIGLYHLIRAILQDQKNIQAARRYTRASRLWLLGIVVMLLTVLTAQTLIIGLVGKQLGPVLQQAGQSALIDRTEARAEQLRLWAVWRDQQVIQLLDQKPLLQKQMSAVVDQVEPAMPALLNRAFRTGLFDEVVLYDHNYNPRVQHGSQANIPIEPRVFSRTVLTGDVQTQVRWQQATKALQLLWVMAIYPDMEGVQSGPWFVVLRTEFNNQALPVGQQQLGGGDWLLGGFGARLAKMSAADLQQGMQLDLADPEALVTPLDEQRAAPLQHQLTPELSTDNGRLAARDAKSRDFSAVIRVPDQMKAMYTDVLNTVDRQRLYVAFTPVDRLGGIYWQQVENQSLIAPLKPVQQRLLLASIAAIVGMLAALWFVWRFQRLRQWYHLQALSAAVGKSSLDWQQSPWAGLLLQGDNLKIQKANARTASLLCQLPSNLAGDTFDAVFTPETAHDRRQLAQLRARRVSTIDCWVRANHLQGVFRAEIRLLTDDHTRPDQFLAQLTHVKPEAAITTVARDIERFICIHAPVAVNGEQPEGKPFNLTEVEGSPFEEIVLCDPGFCDQAFGSNPPVLIRNAIARVMQSGRFVSLDLGDYQYWLLPKSPYGLPTEQVFIVRLAPAWADRLPDLPDTVNGIEQNSAIGALLIRLQLVLLAEWADR